MALLKKVNPAWEPSENKGLKVGETIEVTNYRRLVEGGMAVLVDALGNEIEMPGQVYNCPVCFRVIAGLISLVEHVQSSHLPQKAEQPKVEKTIEGTPVVTEAEALKSAVDAELEKQKSEDLRAKRLAALQKAREARKAKSAQA